MRKGAEGVALFFTASALAAFALFAYYGMEYLFEGNHLQAISLSLGGLLVLSACVFLLCKSKASRDKRKGQPIEIVSLVIASIVLLVGSIPFTMFLSVIDHERDFEKSISETAAKVASIDSCYKDYTTQRVARYRDVLQKKHYNKEIIDSKANSLSRRLMPENYLYVCFERKDWLKSLDTVSIWNISTAKNFQHIVSAGQDWTKGYQEVSNFYYEGEDTIVFGKDSLFLIPQKSYASIGSPNRPNMKSLIATLLCIALILTSYYTIRRPRNKYSGHHR